ncbi:MAG TPA: murein biosynthesis integral membrane protein MurJ, partial [Ktedonobacterales bacterium]|nr:murein biosynthesis integral membrane protein MurJ [Ktedonobacterales bacterium]
TLASGTIAARALGVFNQSVISAHFGAGIEMDAYFATLALPVLLTNLVVNALGSAIVPVYVRMTKDGRDREASEVLSTLLNVVLLFVALLTVLTLLFPRAAVRIMAPGASEATITAGAALAPYLFPILLFSTIIGFLTGIANATRRFGFPAFGAMLVPVGIFLGTILLGNTLGVRGLALGQLGGIILQFLLMLVLSRKLKLHYRPFITFRHIEARTALMQFWPMLIGATIGQANSVIDQIIASLLGSGSISALNYALKVISIPITVIFVAYSQAIYPYLSSQAASRDYKSLKSTISLFAWVVGLVTLGISIVFTVFSGPIIHLLFTRGAFSEQDAASTSATLIGFSVGLVPMAIEFMLTRTFNALQKNGVLMRIAIYTMVTNAALDVLMAHFFGLPGIALATSIDYLLTAVLMLAVLKSAIGPIGIHRPPPQLLRMLAFTPGSARLRRMALRSVSKLEPLGLTFGRTMRNFALVLLGFAAIAVITMKDAVQGLRVAIGFALAFVFIRSPFGLLLTWAALGAFYSVYVLDHSLGYVLALASIPAFLLLIRRETIMNRPWPRALYVYAAFLAWVILGVSLSPLSKSQFAIDVLGYLDYGFVLLLAVTELTTRQRFERFVTVLLCSSTFLSLLGIAQYLLRFGGYQEPGAALVYRVAGIYGWSNSFGFYLCLVLPIAIYRLLTSPRGQRLLWSLVLALHIAALALTFVRTAWLAAFLMIAVAAILLDRKRRKPLLAGIGVVLVAGTALALIPQLGIQKRLLQNVTTLNSRTGGWDALIANFHPTDVLGQGLYASNDLLYHLHPDGVVAPHSLYLQVLFDHGIIGLLLLIMTILLLIGGAVRKAWRSQGNARILAALAAGGLIAAAAYVAVDNEFWVYGLGTYFWLLAALPYARVFESPRYAGTPVEKSTAPSGPTARNSKRVKQQKSGKPPKRGKAADNVPASVPASRV